MERKDYLDSLNWRLGSLRDEIQSLRRQAADMARQLQSKEAQAEQIMHLLSAEGAAPDPDGIPSDERSLADAAYSYLSNSPSNEPVHYRELASKLAAGGVTIPGKDPPANLLSHIVRDSRFARVAPGTYALRSWDAHPVERKKAAKRKTRRSRRKRAQVKRPKASLGADS